MTQTLLDRYLAHLQEHNTRRGQPASPETIRAVRADLRGFMSWWETAKRLSFDPVLVLDRDLADWQMHRQKADGVQPSTINRASATLRSFFAWAKDTGLISHNPAAELRDRPLPDVAPRGISPEGAEWLERIASDQDDQKTRLRDLALLTLLYDCGLRRSEASSVQLRDVDLPGGTLTVRAGKGSTPGRVMLTKAATQRLREYLRVRCPNGLPPIGSEAEREPLLERHALTQPGQPWLPGMPTEAIRKRLTKLGKEAAVKIRVKAELEPDIERVGQLLDLAHKLETVSPHQLRHGLAYRLLKNGGNLAHVQRVLRHSRASTTLMYGKPTEDDLREVLEETSRPTPRARAGDQP